MADRYFSAQPVSADFVVLEDNEARHLVRVMRAEPGDEVIVFDGSGAEFVCEVVELMRNSARLAVRERHEVNRELPVSITAAVSLPKGDRQRWLVEKLTELGIFRLQPLRTERGVAQPSDKVVDRLRRYVIEASKQCGRNKLMEIASATDWSDFAQRTNITQESSVEVNAHPRLLAHPDGADSLCETLTPMGQVPSEIHIAIGPEGGFSALEVDIACKNDWRVVQLGPRILRVETAAVAIASALALAASGD
ncbi:MAG: 16S rRNA (uracil(1498)-N(3))-methyltransferase [Pirellulales bacterium]|nr:16S rRNA (uracil(1498)-N(3))-methyltransferase [Pirellulales bacterium]